jgi:hypothetical protein
MAYIKDVEVGIVPPLFCRNANQLLKDLLDREARDEILSTEALTVCFLVAIFEGRIFLFTFLPF